MAKGKKRTTPIRQEYLEERRRVIELVEQIRRQGYNIDSKDIVGEIPSRVTQKALDQLRDLQNVDDVANEFFDVLKASVQEAPQPTDNTTEEYIPTEWEIAYQNFVDQFTETPDVTKQIILDWAEYSIETFGEQSFLEAVNEAEADGTVWEKRLGYSVEATVEYINAITSILVSNEAQHKATSDYIKEIAEGIELYQANWSQE